MGNTQETTSVLIKDSSKALAMVQVRACTESRSEGPLTAEGSWIHSSTGVQKVKAEAGKL